MAQEDIHTNAQNFPTFAGGGVDPRTGLYTFSLELSRILGGYLQGPSLSLALNYSPLAGDVWGLGDGWSFNLTHMSLEGTPALTLMSGERYRVAGGLGEPAIRERKLRHFRLLRDSASTARVVHVSGLIEHLSRPGSTHYLMPVKLESANGRYLCLEYDEDRGRPRLAAVQDEQGVEHLRIEKSGDTTLRLQTHNGEFVVSLGGGRVEQITLPPDIGGVWSFRYNDLNGYASLAKVDHPQGATEHIEYDSNHAFPGNRLLPLPRVSRHEIQPGFGQPPLVTRYRYGNDNHNFLGFGGLQDWDTEGDDNLFRASPLYRYSVTQIQENGQAQARNTQRTYNSFHLLVEELSDQGPNHIQRTYHYHYQEGTAFDDLPANFQQPSQVTTLWSRDDDPRTRTETALTDYDLDGLLTRQVAPDGRETTYLYYPAEGEQDADGEACPEDPWGFRRHLRSKTEKPAAGETEAGVQVTTWRYGSLALPPADQVAGYMVVNTEQMIEVRQGRQQSRLKLSHSYYQDTADPASFSRLRERKTSYQAPENTVPVDTSLETFAYTVEHGRQLKTTADHTAYAPGAADASEHIERRQSLLTGLMASVTDASDVTFEMAWDSAGRPLATKLIDPLYPALRTARYALKGESGYPETFTVAPNKVEVRTVFDGIGRERERYQVVGQHQSKQWEGHYDGFGRLVEETEFDTLAGQPLALKTSYAFDEWGNLRATLLPDGTRQVEDIDPLGARSGDDIYPQGNQGNRIERWQESAPGPDGTRRTSGRQCQWTNRFGKPERSETWLDENTLEQRTRYTYDGWGNCIRQADTFRVEDGLNAPAVTTWQYDAWQRLVQTNLPNQDVVRNRYAAFTEQGWISEVEAGPGEEALSSIASRQFDGFGRVLSTLQGGRTQQWTYHGGLRSPATYQQPDGTELHYSYRPSLTDEPQAIAIHTRAATEQQRTPDTQWAFEYHPVTAQLLSANSAGAQPHSGGIGCGYEYAPTGELTCETRSHGANESSTRFEYSPGQRQLTRTDSQAGTHRRAYDHAGRVTHETLDEGSVQALLAYDQWGRLASRTAAGVITHSEYDNLGREVARKMTAADTGELLEHLAFGWNGNGNLAWRQHLNADGDVRLIERYSYDVRDRLEIYGCEGPGGAAPDADNCPHDRFGEPMVNQIHVFDTLDNRVMEFVTYSDGSYRETTAEFAAQDPCQLSKLIHFREGLPAEEETFEYDANGRLARQTGTNGKTLTYDTLGRPDTLHTPGNGPHTYRYDALGTLCVSGSKERFYDGYALAHQVDGNRVQRYLSTAGTPLALLEGGHASALLCDLNGSVVGQWNSQERRLSSAIYDAYGNARLDTQFTSDLAFNGESQDQELYPLGRGYRLYDPALARFIAPDSLSYFDGGGLNAYAYCRGNPVMLHDPTGHMPQWNATNLPFYVPPLEQQEESGGGFLAGLFKTIAIGFAAWDLMMVLKGIGLVATAIALPGVGSAAVAAAVTSLALSTAALGTAVWSIADEDSEVAMYVSLGVGVFASAAQGMARSVVNGSASRIAPTTRAASAQTDALVRRNSAPARLGSRGTSTPTLGGRKHSLLNDVDMQLFNRRDSVVSEDSTSLSTPQFSTIPAQVHSIPHSSPQDTPTPSRASQRSGGITASLRQANLALRQRANIRPSFNFGTGVVFHNATSNSGKPDFASFQ